MILIACAQFNTAITQALYEGAKAALLAHGIGPDQQLYLECPGAFELPLLLQQGLQLPHVQGAVALGCVIQGGTRHFDYVAGECARGVMDVMLRTHKPIGFGVLTTYDEAQAEARARLGALDNKGYEATTALLSMLTALKGLPS